ncbi:ABC transporter substrate-binding protein [Acidisphaera sp. L21]|uniref:ABC transporter substrate-binding protein n=1 Tax=Acidisphaera sp. L21 TaxID=1641851 RepID=UPI00131D0F34|nr:ABC transporter substrate-binding protein [Acidisphaera sp. L21]
MRCTLRVSVCAAVLLTGSWVNYAQAAEDITLAALLPTSGPSASVGQEEQQGVQFAMDEINAAGGIRGHMLRINFDDTQGKPDQAVLALNREIDLNKVPAVITAFSAPSLAIAPLATRKKVLVLNPAAQADKLGTASPYMFNTMPLTRDETEVLAHYLTKTLGKKTASIIYENSAAGIDGRNDFIENFKKFGGAILSDEPIQPADTNFRPMILKAAAAKPDVVFTNVIQGDSLPQFVDQVTQHGGFPTVVGTTFLTPAMGLAGSNGWYYTAIRGALPPETDQAIMKKFGTKSVSVYTREYYNDTRILARVAESLIDNQKELTGENFRTELMRIRTFDGVAKISFDTNTAVRNIDILQVQNLVGTKVAEGRVGE